MLSLQSLFGDDAAILRERDFRLLLLANVLPVLGSSLLSPVLNSLIEPFGTSPADVGLMISVFTAPGIVIIPVTGVLADRYGRKPVLVTALVVFGSAGSAIAVATEFRVALGLRLLQGVGFAGISPIIITSIGDLYAGAKEATGQGLRFTVSGLSATVFPPISGALVVIAWQYPFLLYAMALPVAAAVYLWFDEPAPPDVTDATGTAGGTDGADTTRMAGAKPYVRTLFRLVRRNVIWIGFVTYNSLITVRLMDGTPGQAGLLVAVGSLVFAIAGSQAGRITALFGSRLYPLVGANVCIGLGFVVVLLAPGIAVATGGIAVAGIGFGLTLSLYRSIITGLAPDDLRAGLVSIAEAVGRLTNTLTPIAMGGVIAVATPRVGFAPALRLAGVGVAVVGAVGGILCLLVANAAPPVPARTRTPGD
ncbi:MFS transporter [Halobacteriales archaeon QS_5_70_15]|nr:MAG: MFS transporter [Halobacteriales archaeon QS_5_70_15]